MTIKACNWNRIEDPIDLEVWNRLTTNFWLPEKIPLSNDIKSWGKLTDAEKLATRKVFAGLTLLDTMQGTIGAISMIPDATTQHEEAVFTNISFMEAFAGDTELLTPHGWKQIKDITAEDTVAQYHPETNLLDFTSPVIVPSHFSNEVYEIAANNGNARQVVSGGHRIYLEEKTKKENACKTWTHSVYEARNLKDVSLNTAHRRFRSTGVAADGAGMSDIDRLLVAINADGSYLAGSTPRYTGANLGAIPCSFSLSKQRKIDRLKQLATSAGWRLDSTGTRDGHGNIKEQETFKLYVPLEYVHDRSRRFGQWWKLDQVSGTWAREFITENGLWDGHTLKGGHGITFCSTNKADTDFFVAVASLAGYRSRMTNRIDDRSETFSDSYVVYASFTKDTVGAQSMQVNQVAPQQVYCVQVPSTFLLTRNGESPVISGNCVHAKSYSSIFSTLCSTEEIDEVFRWVEENDILQRKAGIINRNYVDKLEDHNEDAAYRKAASVMLESFMFYSGFYLPFKLSSQGRLTNTADVIRLILRDEGVHGYYIGYKFQMHRNQLPEAARETLDYWVYTTLRHLYDLECKYAEEIYDPVGWTENVKTYLRYNANKTLQNMGYDSMFEDHETRVEAVILTAMAQGDENHDFFSGGGSSYIMGKAEETTDDDWS